MRFAKLAALATTIIVLSAPDIATAESVVLGAVADNMIYEGFPQNTCGGGPHIIAGRTNGGFRTRALLRFDLAAAGIPDNATIDSVILTLHLDRTQDFQARTMRLHPLTLPWGEGTVDCSPDNGVGLDANPGDATWFDAQFQQQSWAMAGGDFGAPSASTLVSTQLGSDVIWNSASAGNAAMAVDVQNWFDNPAANFGWILIGTEDTNQTTRRFDSHESSAAPQLTVNFTTPVQLFACCFASGDCAVQTTADCTNAGGVPDATSSSCVPNMCAQPLGACCNPDESCGDNVERDICELAGGTFQGSGTQCSDQTFDCGLEPFVDPLPIPGVFSPSGIRSDGVAQYQVSVQETVQQLHSELPPSTLWTYGGKYPGDSFETRVGQPIEVTWINGLPPGRHLFAVDECAHGPNYYSDSSRVVTHLHGGHVPARFDGQPEFTLMPGELDVYEYPNLQLPAAMWYHDHALGITRLNVYGGMAGFYFLRDDYEDALGLPDGEFEVPLLIQDRDVDLATGQLNYPASLVNSFFGDKVLVNGKIWPVMNVKQGKYRLRILNGSQARAYRLQLENLANPAQAMPLTLIGTDLGLISAPLQLDTLDIAAAERLDVIVDFSALAAGTQVVMRNNDTRPPAVPNVMKFVVTAEPGFAAAIPATLRPVEEIPEGGADVSRWFRLENVVDGCSGSQWLIRTLDGPGGNPTGAQAWDDISEFVQLGTTEIWEFENPSGATHPVHIHLVAFQILDRTRLSDGMVLPLQPQEHTTWKDTVPVGPGTRVRVIATFEDYPGRFAYHCHILDHEDHEMMRQFQAVNDPLACDNDGYCEAGEDGFSCPGDCARVGGALCGNGLCEIGDGEDCSNCPSDCNGGAGFCCGASGPDAIGCGTSGADTRCIDSDFNRFCRVMERLPATCGDRLCEGQESAAACPQDCTMPSCEPSELTDEVSCNDGADNDCDGTIDAADSDCPLDTDGDGTADAADNCLLVANGPVIPDAGGHSQRDTDNDNIGNACDPDIAIPNECAVNFADLKVMRDAFYTAPTDPDWNPDADLTGDGLVNFDDLDVMKSAFFGAPGPSGLPNACSTP